MNFQDLYLEMTQSTEIIRVMLTGISQQDAQFKKNKKTWSILEVTCHLHDTEREDFREHLGFILHRQQDGEWSAIDPQAWVTERKYNQQDFNKMKGKFFRERERSLAWLKGLKNTNWNIKYTSQWGSMPAGEMFASWVAHDNLHIRQLTELRRMLIEQKTKPYKIQYAGEW